MNPFWRSCLSTWRATNLEMQGFRHPRSINCWRCSSVHRHKLTEQLFLTQNTQSSNPGKQRSDEWSSIDHRSGHDWLTFRCSGTDVEWGLEASVWMLWKANLSGLCFKCSRRMKGRLGFTRGTDSQLLPARAFILRWSGTKNNGRTWIRRFLSCR